jgi:hypothetical protein
MNKIEQKAIDMFTAHQSRFLTIKEMWADLEARYSNHSRPGSISERTESNIQLGKAYSMVENALPRLLSQQPKYRYLAVSAEDEEAVEKYEAFGKYQWEEAEVSDKALDLARWGLMIGLVGYKVGWKREARLKKKKEDTILGLEIKKPLIEKLPVLKKMTKKKSKEVQEVTSNFTFDVIKPFDLIWDVNAICPRDAKMLGHKMRKTIGELKELGFDTSGIKVSAESDYWRRRMEEKDGAAGAVEYTLSDSEPVELVEMYLYHQDKDILKLYQVYLAGVGEGAHGATFVLRSEEAPLDEQFIPMGVWRPIRRPGKFYGFGLIEPCTGVLDAEEDYLNMLIEAEWTNVCRPMAYNPSMLHHPEDLAFEPRILIPVKGTDNVNNAVGTIETPKPDIGGGMALTEYLRTIQQNTSGITDFQTGSDEIKGAKTLGEIQIKTEESNQRIKMMLDSLEKEFLQPLGEMVLNLNKQYLADEQEVFYRILGRKGDLGREKLDFETVEAIKDVSIVSGSSAMVMQQAEIQKWSLLLNQAAQELSFGPMGVPVNREKMWENLLEKGFLRKDVEAFLPSVKEREEKEVGALNDQLDLAVEENDNIFAARVTPDQDHPTHLRLHRRALTAEATKDRQLYPSELIRLNQHIDEHTAAMGGQVPNYEQGIAGMAGQQPGGAPPQQAGPGAGPGQGTIPPSKNPGPPGVG